MENKHFEQQLIDYLDGKLTDEQRQKVQDYIDSNQTNREELEKMKALFEVFDQVREMQPSGNLRTGFYEMLEEEKQLQSPKVISVRNSESQFPWKRAFQIAASFLLLFLGYFAGSFGAKQEASQEIANLKVQTVELKERMTLTMFENRSASTRIQAVNFSEELEKPDTTIITALIERMQYDSNINVRIAAAEALYRFSDSEMVKTAFIDALGTVKEPDLQIAIIQFLVDIQEKRAIEPMKQLLDHPETPDFVKAQANSGISEII
ncbi:HEAT repeat domain-containing protein [Winogradskyella sp.]|uniref:HEAT repeat domain-containing protein n=1 Tax=Winogradskyella sp. TaxID=1883156 RepID=UPI002609CCEE|nr:HEAT repeat domain-containing protein [Winogradskyella sp.]